MNNKFYFMENGLVKYYGHIDEYINFTKQKQLYDIELWKKFVDVYRSKTDTLDNGWRGEYWGKMMRGACLIYQTSNDLKLYTILEETVKDMLSTQDEYGRFSTYDIKNEFQGWDIWGRKYVLTALEYFIKICKDEILKRKIILAMKSHVLYMIDKIGDSTLKKEITDTSNIWGGINSCSILESIVELYKITLDNRFLKFAEYIISTGGCKNGNIIEEALNNTLLPYKYHVIKAYETMSFFEGLLAYYEVTENFMYFKAVDNFIEAVNKSEITIIGCAGCLGELFNNAILEQTKYQTYIMQETCVAVTWIRLNVRIMMLTGNLKYASRIECSSENALYGSVNIYDKKQYVEEKYKYVEGLPFDSYSPLTYNTRGKGVGGYKEFRDGSFYGCCACIAAAGIALYPLQMIVAKNRTIIINEYYKTDVCIKYFKDMKISFNTIGSFLKNDYKILVNSNTDNFIEFQFRSPEWCDNFKAEYNGKAYYPKNGYISITRKWLKGDEIFIFMDLDLKYKVINGKTSFSYGPYILATDTFKGEAPVLNEKIELEKINGKYLYDMIKPQEREIVRIKIRKKDGSKLLLTDYASCGKNWDKNSIISVWHDIV